MTRKGLAFGSAIALAVVAAAIAAMVVNLDPNRYRGQIIAMLEDATGRAVTIGGDLEYRFTPLPRLTVSDVTVANAPWGSRPEMLHIGRAEAAVHLLPLFEGRVEVAGLVLDHTRLLLERSAEGEGNWRFGSATGGDQGAGVALEGEVTVQNFHLTWRDGTHAQPLEFGLERLTLAGGGAAAPRRLEAAGRYGETPFELSGTVDSLAALQRGEPLKLELAVEAVQSTFKLAGTIRDPLSATGLDLAIEASGPSPATLAALLKTEPPDAGPWSLNVRVADMDGGYRLTDLRATLVDGEITGHLDFRPGTKRPRVEARLKATGLDLDRLLQPGGTPPEDGNGRLFSTRPLPLAALTMADSAVKLEGRDLRVAGMAVEALSADIAVEDGTLTVAPFELRAVGSEMSGKLTVDTTAEPPTLVMSLSSRALDMERLQQALAGRSWLAASGRMEIAVRGRGRSLAALMAGLDGTVKMAVGEGVASTRQLDAVTGGLTRLVGTLVAEDTDRAQLNCAVCDFDIAGGVATSRVLLVDTEHSTVYGKGTVDLGSEKLDLLLTPKPKSVTLSVAVPLEVGGTLTHPTYTPEKVAVTKKAVGLLAAVGLISFPPAALLALGELGGADNPCLDLAAKRAAKDGTGDTGTARGDKNAVEQAVEGIGNALKGIFGD